MKLGIIRGHAPDPAPSKLYLCMLPCGDTAQSPALRAWLRMHVLPQYICNGAPHMPRVYI